jgi:hypothetical protein
MGFKIKDIYWMDVRSNIEQSPYFIFFPIFQPVNYSPFNVVYLRKSLRSAKVSAPVGGGDSEGHQTKI